MEHITPPSSELRPLPELTATSGAGRALLLQTTNDVLLGGQLNASFIKSPFIVEIGQHP